METSKFRTNVGKDGTIKLPAHILENIKQSTEYEMVMRPLRKQKKGIKAVDEVIQSIELSMTAKYPKLKREIIPECEKIHWYFKRHK